MMWGLCYLCLAWALRAVQAGPIRRTSKMDDKAAPQDEVNVLMFGVVQFSESLNYVYETTEAKIAKISQTLSSREDTLRQLGEQTEQAAEVENQIKGVIRLLQAQMAKRQTQTKRTKDRLAQIEKQEVELRAKVKRLEMYINNTFLGIKELQERAAENSNTLKGLQHLTQFQKQNIATHDDQLSALQEMSEAT